MGKPSEEEFLKECFDAHPENLKRCNKNRDYYAREDALYQSMLYLHPGTEEWGNAVEEFLQLSVPMFYALCNKSFEIWKTESYSLVSFDDAVSELKLACLEVITEKTEPKWCSISWVRVQDRAKENLHKRYYAGGISESRSTHLRKLKKGDEGCTFTEYNDVLDSRMTSGDDPEAVSVSRETANEMERFLRDSYENEYISFEELEAILATEWGLSDEQLAEKYGVSTDAIRKRRSRGRKKLRNLAVKLGYEFF